MQFKENGLEMFPKHVKMSCITYATNCKKLHSKHNGVKLFFKIQLLKQINHGMFILEVIPQKVFPTFENVYCLLKPVQNSKLPF